MTQIFFQLCELQAIHLFTHWTILLVACRVLAGAMDDITSVLIEQGRKVNQRVLKKKIVLSTNDDLLSSREIKWANNLN